MLKVRIVLGQSLDEVELGAIMALEPREYVQLKAAHGHCQAPFAGFF